MRVKYLFIYLGVGVAFLGVSLWAFLTNGRSARALRAKYKIGGLLLTSWAMFSAASCEGPFVVNCYEPVVTCYDVAEETDIISVTVKDYGGSRLKSGDVLVIKVDKPTYAGYRCKVTSNTQPAVLIQSEQFVPGDPASQPASFEMTLAATDYKGEATVTVSGVRKEEDGSEKEYPVGGASITIL